MKYNNEHIFELILDNTKTLLNEKGVKGWSMDQLAMASGLAKNTLYKIIGSKKEAVLSVIYRDMDEVQHHLKKRLKTEADTIMIEDLIDTFLLTFSNLHGKYLKEVLIEFPGNGPRIENQINEMRWLLAELFELVRERSHLRADIDVELLFNCLRGISTEFIRLGYTGERFVEKSKTAYGYLLKGICE
ncbi:TetR/AcrR family transcriptional regulator [Petrocella sp. FN5]|uniref:TetR/AcrR family transcriptional regulator n=1 Tax=Petrocella sp. FN5 TaxID=3032002 RepID=UPI0023DAD4F2|nr:TetR/AcrR family transcriptional regulator [Petrocella sp. FN5]MDF1616758.1 TetR/AcrR family transcriptional regulator [Petrocella sp. FN5]